MPIYNADIAAMFEEIADLQDIRGDNPFRIRAYRNAARTVTELGTELHEMLGQGKDLTDIAGIGKELAEKIRQVVETGTFDALEKLRGEMPAGITDLLQIPNLGPKRVKSLYRDLGVDSIGTLEAAAKEQRIRALPGFGEKMEAHILEGVRARAARGHRYVRAAVTPYADSLLAHLRKVRGVRKVAIAGSYRRARETVGDVDLLAIVEGECTIMEQFTKYDGVTKVLAHGETKSSVVLRGGIQVDLRVVPEESFGAALCYFTGSKAHNIAIRKLGQRKGLKINEYGVFRGDQRVAGRTEDEVYESVGLTTIPPELREDRGEVDAARAMTLPRLVEESDLRGDLHMHTAESDGQNSIAEMALAARSLGYEYIAITEHSKRLAMAGGLDERRLMAQIEEIDRLNEDLTGFAILKGIEVDILEDGGLDLADSLLSRLDLVVASVHSRFKMDRRKQTERIMRAMDRPHFTLFAHPTGRLLQERDPYEVDVPRLIRHAKKRGCFLELNSHPLRLDLNDLYCRMAKDEGVLVSINTDAHSVGDLDNVRFGIGQARRGWMEKDDILNTRRLHDLRAVLARTMSR